MVVKLDVLWSLAVHADEIFVSRRPLVLGIAGKHALQAHADALNVLHWTPSLLAEEVKADDAV
jgi:hypothetical protein